MGGGDGVPRGGRVAGGKREARPLRAPAHRQVHTADADPANVFSVVAIGQFAMQPSSKVVTIVAA
jgi:hypothetical protein